MAALAPQQFDTIRRWIDRRLAADRTSARMVRRPSVRAVIVGIATDAQIVDIAHAIRKFAIRDGAFLSVRRAVPTAGWRGPVAVVDPGVGTERRPIAIRTTAATRLVGPDNGLFIPAARDTRRDRGSATSSRTAIYALAITSTFHGRDIFSSGRPHIWRLGTPFEGVGPVIPTEDLVDLR